VRQKLFAGVLVTSLAALLISGASLFLYDLHSYRRSSSNSLTVEAQLLGYGSTAALQFDDPAVATQNLAFLKARPTIRAAAIYNPRGAVFAAYTRPDISKAEIPNLPGADGVAISGDRISVFNRIVAGNELVGSVYLAEDLEMYKRIGNYVAIAFAVVLAGLVASAALSAWLLRGITQPIIQISDLSRQVVEKRDYAVRANRTTDDEIGTLAEAFNEMLAEIQRRTSALESSSAEVQRLNQDLERRVSERTAQLEESNQQLHGANLAKSNFLSMMSHEIRTPMNGVLGMLELLALTELDPRQRMNLGIVRESGRSLMRIIDDILDFSKIEAGKLEIQPEVSSVARVVATSVEIYSGNASNKALLLKSHVDPRISPAVVVDPLRLQQILNNLVNNAIKFTSQGFVEIRADLVQRKDGVELVKFSVIDTGIGISREAQATLFQPFTQATGGVARAFGGTGLGLSIAQRLARLMGGSVAITSELGRGTIVSLTLSLPIAEPHLLPALDGGREHAALAAALRARRAPPTVSEAEAEGTLVLVVDDHPVNRVLLMHQMTELGYANETAEDGRQALELWRTGRFGLVVTDCNMPEMDGYELARAIRREEKATGRPRIVIIACTANAIKGEAENCLAAGMDDYIAKPVALPRLMVKLDQWLPLPRGQSRPPVDGKATPIDHDTLAQISSGDPALEHRIFVEFLRANGDDIAGLESAYETRDAALMTQAAHRIKGSAKTIGALDLAQICNGLEAAARAHDWATIAADEPAFRAEAHRLVAYLEALVRRFVETSTE
jgi:signal transduction histidine kinase/CheY-like chemotaxis protein/HPt (histidine-containing phosphotransfer) domain-containing protein